MYNVVWLLSFEIVMPSDFRIRPRIFFFFFFWVGLRLTYPECITKPIYKAKPQQYQHFSVIVIGSQLEDKSHRQIWLEWWWPPCPSRPNTGLRIFTYILIAYELNHSHLKHFLCSVFTGTVKKMKNIPQRLHCKIFVFYIQDGSHLSFLFSFA